MEDSRQELIDLAKARMPFGKFKDTYLLYIPEEYFVWMKNNGGFPAGKLGRQMALMLEIKMNGLEELIKPLMPKRQY
jgi:uncharacterized protein (DUF3820 family)